MMMMVKIVDIIFARTPFWSTIGSAPARAVGHYIHGSEPTGPVAHIQNRHFPFILANIAGTSLFKAASRGIYADYSIRIPELLDDHQLLDLFGAFENVVNLRISMPAFYRDSRTYPYPPRIWIARSVDHTAARPALSFAIDPSALLYLRCFPSRRLPYKGTCCFYFHRHISQHECDGLVLDGLQD